MQIRQVKIARFRGIDELTFEPGARCVILGPQNACKSTVLEALDLLLHHGFGRPRQPPTEIDYFARKPQNEFEVEATLGQLRGRFLGQVREYLEGWRAESHEVVAEPEGEGIKPVVRVRVRGTPDLTFRHEFSKPEASSAYFGPGLRSLLGWVFDGRTRDPLHQLSFYQGGLLEKLFSSADLDPPTQALRDALQAGAQQVNADSAVGHVLAELAEDLRNLGLLKAEQTPVFEAGAVSKRQLLQSLRLAMPAGEELIPLFRQGRGAQRLILVSILLRLADLATGDEPVVGGFEEPEEALEPLRQTQLAGMLTKIADRGGQVFVVTHSPEIARRFEIDDFLLMSEGTAGHGGIPLRRVLTPPVRQTYERRLDGAVVRGLFARIPILVEGPGDRAVFDVFWRSLAEGGGVRPAEELGLDPVNCEGAPGIPMHAAVLKQAGKKVVAWAERDTQDVRGMLKRLRNEGNCAALILYGEEFGKQNLEQALAEGCSVEALAAAMKEIAADRGYSWESQKEDLVSRCDGEEDQEVVKEAIQRADFLLEALGALNPEAARIIIRKALGSKSASPFDLKGGRQARIFASKIVDVEGVPAPFVDAFVALQDWIRVGCPDEHEIPMWSRDGQAG